MLPSFIFLGRDHSCEAQLFWLMGRVEISKDQIHAAKLRWNLVPLLVHKWGKSLDLVLHRAGREPPLR